MLCTWLTPIPWPVTLTSNGNYTYYLFIVCKIRNLSHRTCIYDNILKTNSLSMCLILQIVRSDLLLAKQMSYWQSEWIPHCRCQFVHFSCFRVLWEEENAQLKVTDWCQDKCVFYIFHVSLQPTESDRLTKLLQYARVLLYSDCM